LEKIPEAGTRRRAEQLYQQLDMLPHLRQQARRELRAESRKPAITAQLRPIPSLGPIRSALAVSLIQTPHRFRSKRQLWTYSGLGLETRDSGEYHYVGGQVRRRKKQATIRGLNKDFGKASTSRRSRKCQASRHSVMMRSAHSTMETKIAGLPNLAPH
jgi:transposase